MDNVVPHHDIPSLLGAPPGPLRLLVRGDGEQAGNPRELPRGRIVVGAGEDSDLRLNSPLLASAHCLILHGARQTIVRRLAPDASLNGLPFETAALQPGDRLQLADLLLEVLAGELAAEAPFPTPPLAAEPAEEVAEAAEGVTENSIETPAESPTGAAAPADDAVENAAEDDAAEDDAAEDAVAEATAWQAVIEEPSPTGEISFPLLEFESPSAETLWELTLEEPAGAFPAGSTFDSTTDLAPPATSARSAEPARDAARNRLRRLLGAFRATRAELEELAGNWREQRELAEELAARCDEQAREAIHQLADGRRLHEQLDSLSGELAEQQQRHERQRRVWNAACAELRNRLYAAEQALQARLREADQLRRLLTEAQGEIDRLQTPPAAEAFPAATSEETLRWERELAARAAEAEDALLRVRQLAAQLEEADARVARWRGDAARSAAELEQLSTRHAALREAHEQVVARHQELSREHRRLAEEHEALRRRHEELLAEGETATAARQTDHASLDELRRELEERRGRDEAELAALREELSRAEERFHALAEEHAATREAARDARVRLEEEADLLRRERDQLLDRQTELQSAQAALLEERRELSDRLAELQQARETAREEQQQLREQLRAWELEKEQQPEEPETDDSASEIAEWHARYAALEAEHAALSARWDDLQQRHRELSERAVNETAEVAPAIAPDEHPESPSREPKTGEAEVADGRTLPFTPRATVAFPLTTPVPSPPENAAPEPAAIDWPKQHERLRRELWELARQYRFLAEAREALETELAELRRDRAALAAERDAAREACEELQRELDRLAAEEPRTEEADPHSAQFEAEQEELRRERAELEEERRRLAHERDSWHRQQQSQHQELQLRREQLHQREVDFESRSGEIASLRGEIDDELRRLRSSHPAEPHDAPASSPELFAENTSGEETPAEVYEAEAFEEAESASEGGEPLPPSEQNEMENPPAGESVEEVIRRLGMAGILRDEEPAEEAGLEAAEEPYREEPPVEPVATPAVVEHASGKHEEGEESIEDYMARLMARVRGEANSGSAGREAAPREPAAPRAAEPSPAEAPKDAPGAAPAIVSPEEYRPSRKAPERDDSLAAMRELANQTARAAIKTSTALRTKNRAGSRLYVAGVTTLLSLGLVVFCDWRTLPFWGGVIGGTLGSIWLGAAIRTIRRGNAEERRDTETASRRAAEAAETK